MESNVRCMACVCLKNAIDKFWRKTAPNAIKEEERVLLKNQFLQYLNEPELKIARQMSVVLGKLARFDLPHQWPDLMTKLIQILQETSTPEALTLNLSASSKHEQQNLSHSRCLMALHQIIKSLSSKRLSSDRKIFEELSVNIIDMLLQLAFFYVEKCLINPLGEHSINLDEASLKIQLQEHSFYLDQAIICLKILHKLVLHGFKDNSENGSLKQLMASLFQSFEKLITKYNLIMATRQQILIDYFKV